MTKLYINPKVKKGHIRKEIQGHFSEHLGRCIYEGVYVGEDLEIRNTNGMRNDVVEALKEVKIPVLRWPGGCFADEYHWKDGIGPKKDRKKMVNTNWGGVVEDNSFGTDEYMELCRQIGCKTYINGNLGSGTVQEMSEWVEYMTFDGISPMAKLRTDNGHPEPYQIDYFGVGNESWGGGGNMTADYYGNLYRRYQTFLRDFKKDFKISKIACGANEADYLWTEEVLATTHKSAQPNTHGYMDGLSLHYYTVPGSFEHKKSAVIFDEKDWYETMKKTLLMDTLIKQHGAIMDKYDPDKRIGMIVDEWGTWFEVELGTNPGFLFQQNTMRDALVAGINLNIFNKHCDRVHMANIAQLVNVLQALILTDGEKMILTPTYHVFNMYKYHQEGELLDSSMETKEIGVEDNFMVPNLTESVSLGTDGKIHLTITNLSLEEDYPVEALLIETKISKVAGTILTNTMDAHNTFEKPDEVTTESFDGCKITDGGVSFVIPKCSILHVEITTAE